MTLLIHVTAGAVGLASGYLALFVAKGGGLHRKSGMVFVCAMLTMSVAGLTMAIARDRAPAVNVPAALLTAYLVVTSLTTVRPLATGSRALHIAGMSMVFAVSMVDVVLGAEAVANGGKRQGIPAFPFFLFAVTGLLASAGDLRILRTGALRGAHRIARHLWRMSFALFIAALSFFLGQAKVIPKPIRIPALLAVPVLIVLVSMIYWMWRVRFRKSLRGIVGMRAPEVAGMTGERA